MVGLHMQSMLAKTGLREIRQSFGRFAAIFGIVALGVAFFAGLRVCRAAMIRTADEYLSTQGFFDYRILSTVGFEQDDVEAFARAEGVKAARGSISVDFLAELGEYGSYVLKACSLTGDINAPSLVAGRMPQAPDECIADALLFDEEMLGLVITVAEDNDDDLILAYDAYKVVGIANSPLYLNYERGTTSLGSGVLSGFVLIPQEGFDSDYFTEVYLLLDDTAGVPAYSSRYDQQAQESQEPLTFVAEARAAQRSGKLVTQAQETLDEAAREYNDGLAEYERQKADAEQELEQAKKELEDGERELELAQEEYADGEKKLADARAQLDDGWREYNEGLETYNSQYPGAQRDLADARAQLDSGFRQYEEGKAQLEDAARQIRDGEEQIAAGQKQIDDGFLQLSAANDALAEGWAQYYAGYDEFMAVRDSTLLELEIGKLALDLSTPLVRAALEAAQELGQDELVQELQAQLDEMEAQYAQIEDGYAQLAAAEKQLADALAQLQAGQAEVSAGYDALFAAQRELEAKKRELEDAKAEYEASLPQARKDLEDAFNKLVQGEKEYRDGVDRLTQAGRDLNEAYRKLLDGEKEYNDGLAELQSGARELADARAQLDEGWQAYRDGRAEADEKFAEAKAKLDDGRRELDRAREQLENIKSPKVYVLGRDTNVGYVCFDSDTDIVDGISRVLPLFFFLIAALVCSTTMTRMVDEQRTQIGVFKAMGYGNAAITGKYVFYAGSAAMLGCAAGFVFGTLYFPRIIWMSYGIMYGFSDLLYVFDPVLLLESAAVSLLSSAGVTWLSCRTELSTIPAMLLRPKAPRVGKLILLERIGVIWKQLHFLQKIAARNIFRYKKRLFMMVLGIGGCTALMIAGFGIGDSIQSIVDDQFTRISHYDIAVTFSESFDESAAETFRADCEHLSDEIWFMRASSMDIYTGKAVKTVAVIAGRSEGFERFTDLHGTDGGKIAFPQPGYGVITNGIAERMGIRTGDTVTLTDSEMNQVVVTISGVCENYINNYIYLDVRTLEEQLGQTQPINQAFVLCLPDADAHEAGAYISSLAGVTGVTVTGDMRERVGNMMSSLDYITMLTVICAAALAFIVLYNLTNININERVREIATIKVLGFTQFETMSYVLRENIVLCALGALAGLPLGKLLHAYVMSQIKVEMVTFYVRVDPISYLVCVALTFAFAYLVNLVMALRLNRISMTESLKSIE